MDPPALLRPPLGSWGPRKMPLVGKRTPALSSFVTWRDPLDQAQVTGPSISSRSFIFNLEMSSLCFIKKSCFHIYLHSASPQNRIILLLKIFLKQVSSLSTSQTQDRGAARLCGAAPPHPPARAMTRHNWRYRENHSPSRGWAGSGKALKATPGGWPAGQYPWGDLAPRVPGARQLPRRPSSPESPGSEASTLSGPRPWAGDPSPLCAQDPSHPVCPALLYQGRARVT